MHETEPTARPSRAPANGALVAVQQSSDLHRSLLGPRERPTDGRTSLRLVLGPRPGLARTHHDLVASAEARTDADQRPAALILSLEPEVRSTILGEAVPDPGSVEQCLVEIGETLLASAGAHLVVFNCSTLHGRHRDHAPGGRPDGFATTVRALNLALIRASQRHDLSIVDVDRLVAEAGGEHVTDLLEYSSTVYGAAGEEVERILEERGIVASHGHGADVRRLALPSYDRRVSEARIVAWHKSEGETVAYGDLLLEVVAEGLRSRLDPGSGTAPQGGTRKKARNLALSVTSGEEGVLRRITASAGRTVSVGETIGVFAASTSIELPSGAALDQARDFRVVAAPVSE